MSSLSALIVLNVHIHTSYIKVLLKEMKTRPLCEPENAMYLVSERKKEKVVTCVMNQTTFGDDW
jgi:hypothetical protein